MKPFRAPNLKAPRYRSKRMEILNKEFCQAFRNKYPEYSSLSDEDIKDKIKLINSTISKKIIEERDGVELPNGLGYIFIGTCRAKTGENTDYKKSKELGVKVQHQNWGCDNNVAKIFYTNFEQRYNFRFHEFWGFKGSREFTRAVSSEFPQRWEFYLKIDGLRTVSKLFRRLSKKLDETILTQ